MAASADRVWDLVSDITRIGEFSPETFEAEWLGDATGPAVGARFRGVKGSAAAFLGITFLPFVIVIILGALYESYGDRPGVTGALLGVSASAAGMILAMAARIAQPLLSRRPGEALPVMILVFTAVALLNLPLLWVIAGAIPLSIGISWWRRG